MTDQTPVRVVLVDDHRMFRSGVRAELGDAVEVVGEAEDADQAITVIRATRPDVVLLDVHLPGGGGRAVLAALVAELPDVRFLALSVSDAPEDVISVIRGGARGYVTKSITGPELAGAVRRVADGDAVFSPRLAGFVLDRMQRIPEVGENFTENGWCFEVVDLDGRRIDKVLASRRLPTRRNQPHAH